jgi:hypothetical protein
MDKIDKLTAQIKKGKFPTEFPHFGGANLIITDDSKRKGYEHDVVICSEHASALSWLVFQLKEIYNSELDYINKYDFYPYIGELIQSSLNANDELIQTMLFVVQEMKEYYFS